MAMAVSVPTKPYVTHTCGTLFQFSTNSKEEIVEWFVSATGEDVTCQVDEDYFVIRCSAHDETSVPLLLQHLQTFIRTEIEKEPDLFEDAKVTPVRGTYADKKSKEATTQVMADVGFSDDSLDILKDDHKSDAGSNSVSQCTFLIAHESITRTWTPDVKKGLLKHKARAQILGRLETICHCRIEFSNALAAGPHFVIKSDGQQNIDSVISKLIWLDDVTHQQSTFPHVFSYPVLEGKMSVMLQIITLKTLNDARLRTTLLPQSTSPFKDVGDASVVSMVQEGQIIPVIPTIVQKSSAGPALWKEYPYKEFGVQLANDPQSLLPLTAPVVQYDVLAAKLATPTGQWLQQNPSEYEDAFKPAEIDTQQQTTDVSHDLPTAASESVKLPPRRLRIPRVAARTVGTEVPTSSDAAMPKAASPPGDPGETPSINRAIELSDQKVPPKMENQQPLRALGAPKIEPPYIPSANNATKSTDPPRDVVATPPTTITTTSSRSSAWQSMVVQEAKGGELIDLAAEPRKPANTKVFRRTMGQRKPQQGITGSNAKMMKGFEEAATQLLNLALPQCGTIELKVGIGRLLIHSSQNVTQTKKPFALAEWSSAFPFKKQRGPLRSTTYTPRLTTRALDIEGVLNTKAGNGRKLFKDEIQDRKVIYVISCVTKSNERLVIEVGEDGDYKIKGPGLATGAIDWHYPLRSWDTRLDITTYEPVFGDYQQQAQGIVNSMKIQNQAHGKAIRFSTATIDGTFSIDSVVLRRETTHASVIYPDLLLRLSEVQDLAVEKLPYTDNQYQGWIFTPAWMMSSGRLWWETYITSIHATKALQENDTMELGEVAKWSPEDIINRGVIKDIYALANELVTNMDHVGFYNRAVQSNSDPRTGTRSRTNPGTSDPDGEYPW